jgi:hypothetical protein
MNTLREAVESYLAMRRGLGFKLREAGKGLLDFASFLEQRGATYITTSLALEWAQQPSSAQPAHWAQRLSYVRGFARYRSAVDPRTEIPSSGLLPHCPGRARPYLYTDEEINHLLVPLHDSTQRVLADYKRRRDDFLAGRPAPYFFISKWGKRLDGAEVRRTFYQLSRQVGLRDPDSSSGPRLHDFRHRFAVETLLRWYRAGEDVERRLPVLSTYLGHVHVSDTYWYLTACPELMGQAVKRLEQRWEVQS